MAKFDQKNDLNPISGLDIQAITTDTTTVGNVIDMKRHQALTFAIFSGTLTDGTYTPLVEESDASGSGYTAVADGDLIGTEAEAVFALTDDNIIKKIGYRGDKQFVRLSLVSTVTTAGGTIGAVAIQGRPSDRPVV